MQIAGKIINRILTGAVAVTIAFAFAGVAHARVNANPSFVNFGNESLGSASAARTVTITNEYWHDITIVSIFTSAGQFSITGPSLPVTLDRGESLTVSVRFRTSAAQAYSGNLEFRRANGWTTWVALSGIGTQSSSNNVVAPSISSQPASVKIIAGQTATFNIAATGTAPMTYLWKKNGNTINGVNSSTYTTPAETTSDNNAQFTVSVTNSAGSITSNPAVLTVTSAAVAPSITTQPASQTVIAGKTASFMVAATGTAPLNYQWSKNGIAIPNANSSAYTTPAESSVDNNAKFTVAVSNSAG